VRVSGIAPATRVAATVATLLMPCFGAAACGSSSSSSSTSGSASTATASADPGAAAISAAEAAVAKYSHNPPPIELPPVGKPIPKNVTIDFISVDTPSIGPLNSGVLQGAKALGWNVKIETPSAITPQGYISALQSAVAQKPAGLIFFTPLPLSSFQTELTKLQAEGVPIVTAGAANYPVGGSSPVKADTSGANIFGPLAQLLADGVIAAAKGTPPDVGWVVDSSVPAWTVMTTDFTNTIKAAGGTAHVFNVPESAIGSTSGSTIVSDLEANPGIKYLCLVVGAYDTGLETALATAGLANKVIISDTDAASTDIQGVKDGQLSDTIVIETNTDGLREVDLMARLLAHTNLPYVHVPSDFLYVTKSNINLVGSNTQLYAFPDDFSSFQTAWGVKG